MSSPPWTPAAGPLPSVFACHGTPMLAADDEDPFAQALGLLADRMPQPRGVVVLSAHSWGGTSLRVDAASRMEARHDFAGFPRELYDVAWSAPGDPELAARVVALVRNSLPEREPQLTGVGTLDHGAWIPLRWMFPHGQVPVVPISIPADATPRDLLRLGTLLAPLRRQGVLLLATGAAVYNRSRLEWHGKNAPAPVFALEFEAWVRRSLETGRVEDLAAFADAGPRAEEAHPSHEHFLPLLFALGAALPDDVLNVFFAGIQYRSISMLSFCLMQPALRVLDLSIHG